MIAVLELLSAVFLVSASLSAVVAMWLARNRPHLWKAQVACAVSCFLGSICLWLEYFLREDGEQCLRTAIALGAFAAVFGLTAVLYRWKPHGRHS